MATPSATTSPPLFDLGLDGLRLFDRFARSRDAWHDIARSIANRPFLRSEGMVITASPPQIVEGPLLERFREIVARFDAFYRSVIGAYYTHPALRAELMPDPMFEAMLEAERTLALPLPLTRLDLVVTDDGALRVIEINSVGVCTHHIRTAAYLGRELARFGWTEDARLLSWFYDEMVASVRRCYEARAPIRVANPRIAVLYTGDMFRTSRVLWRDAFTRRGWRFVACHATELEITPEGARVRGEPVDVVWGDYLFFFGHQHKRYTQTKFPTRFGDYDRAPAETARIVENANWLRLVADGRVVCVSPCQAYIAWSKHVLSWIHRDDRPIVSGERDWLQRHVARTWAVEDRSEGALSAADAVRMREELLIKPCRYGGSHGVLPGCETSPAEWAQRVEEIWHDPEWVVQEFHAPRRTADGQFLSLGLYNYNGRLGGVTIRAGRSRNVSARNSIFIPAIVDDGTRGAGS